MAPELAGLVGAGTVVLIELARLLRDHRLRQRGDKRTREDDPGR